MLRRVPRLSQTWMPSGGFTAVEAEDAHSKLVRAGFLRQSNSGMFHLLPLGRRVQDKIEGLIVKHMEGDLGRLLLDIRHRGGFMKTDCSLML